MSPQWICFFKAYLIYLGAVGVFLNIWFGTLELNKLNKYQKIIPILIFIILLITPMWSAIYRRRVHQNICITIPHQSLLIK